MDIKKGRGLTWAKGDDERKAGKRMRTKGYLRTESQRLEN